jgi:hypothetical protein
MRDSEYSSANPYNKKKASAAGPAGSGGFCCFRADYGLSGKMALGRVVSPVALGKSSAM